MSAERLLGLHRYEVAQGFQPAVMRFTGRLGVRCWPGASR